MLNHELIVAYLKTSYWVETPAAAIPVRIGQNCPELDVSIRAITADSATNWAIVTAHNPQSQLLSPLENRRRHAALVTSLETGSTDGSHPARTADCSSAQSGNHRWHWPALGVDPTAAWYPETGLCLVGYDEAEVRHIMRTWDQAAAVFGRTGEPATLLFAQSSQGFDAALNTLLGKIAAGDTSVANAATHVIAWHRCRFGGNPAD